MNGQRFYQQKRIEMKTEQCERSLRSKILSGNFLLHCLSYDACRTDLLDSVNSTLQPYDLQNLSNALMLKLILYGDERLSVDSNSEILKATLRYICTTQRFE